MIICKQPMNVSKSKMRNKKPYQTVSAVSAELISSLQILATSIVVDSTIAATGQEIGETYNFTEDPTTGDDAGKHFNHEWE